MKTSTRLNALVAGVAGLLVVGFSPVYAADPTTPHERVEKQMGPEGNPMGVPEPGSVSDMESTKKKRDTSKVKPVEPAFQPIGGGPYLFEGEVLKVEGEHYTIKNNQDGQEVRLIVNQDTNLDCARAPSKSKQAEGMTSDRISAEKQAPQASDQQLTQGQRKDETARGAGFKIGQCDFHSGDHVKVEADDKGHATTLKYLQSSTSR